MSAAFTLASVTLKDRNPCLRDLKQYRRVAYPCGEASLRGAEGRIWPDDFQKKSSLGDRIKFGPKTLAGARGGAGTCDAPCILGRVLDSAFIQARVMLSCSDGLIYTSLLTSTSSCRGTLVRSPREDFFEKLPSGPLREASSQGYATHDSQTIFAGNGRNQGQSHGDSKHWRRSLAMDSQHYHHYHHYHQHQRQYCDTKVTIQLDSTLVLVILPLVLVINSKMTEDKSWFVFMCLM